MWFLTKLWSKEFTKKKKINTLKIQKKKKKIYNNENYRNKEKL